MIKITTNELATVPIYAQIPDKIGSPVSAPDYTDTEHLDGEVAWQLATADTRIGAAATYSASASGVTGAKAPSGLSLWSSVSPASSW